MAELTDSVLTSHGIRISPGHNWEDSCEILKAARKDDSPLTSARPDFQTFTSLFDALNSSPGFTYVVQRSKEEDWEKANFLKDIDVVVNDFYLFKSLTGGRSVNRVISVEMGQNGVQQMVKVMGNEKAFDVRFFGDDFIDERWERDILTRRILDEHCGGEGKAKCSCYIPSLEDQLVYELYYVTYNKPEKLQGKMGFLRDLKNKLDNQMEGVRDLDLDSGESRAKFVDTFMKKHGYTYTRPQDTSVALKGPRFPD
ncbi:hypothetical protein TrST_g9454 [Triparma strigata]|uniref:Uncharacterized protein n=1 Tax=Triparma strigata TaxID=1606541 RepID=A0A9W7EFI1_9STRA|nr:hypothetical protein TrST_g9454 [Triparma strigata]